MAEGRSRRDDDSRQGMGEQGSRQGTERGGNMEERQVGERRRWWGIGRDGKGRSDMGQDGSGWG